MTLHGSGGWMLPLACCLLTGVAPALGETISSGSRQFQVNSSSVTLAHTASESAESIRNRLLEFTGQPNHFTSPIQVVFEDSALGDDLDDYEYVVLTEAGMGKLLYTILGRKETSRSESPLPWADAVVTALQYEQANRIRGKKGGGIVTWPSWFLWGATGLSSDLARKKMDHLRNSKYRRKTYRSLNQIWKTPASVPSDERERIQVLSTWLIQELRKLPDGSAKFARLVHEINRGGFSGEVFARIYQPDFPSLRAAEQWWTARLAYFEHGSELASMDFDETAERLQEALEGGIPEPGLRGLDEKGTDEINSLQKDLYRLMVAGHPMVRPAVEVAINALDSVRANNMRKARPSWNNAATILESLRPWREQINAALDQCEYEADLETSRGWLAKKGLAN
jgi:hypothetical protein